MINMLFAIAVFFIAIFLGILLAICDTRRMPTDGELRELEMGLQRKFGLRPLGKTGSLRQGNHKSADVHHLRTDSRTVVQNRNLN